MKRKRRWTRAIALLCALILCMESVAFSLEEEPNQIQDNPQSEEVITTETSDVLVDPDDSEMQSEAQMSDEYDTAAFTLEGIQAAVAATASVGTVSDLMKSLRADINAAVYNTDLNAPFSKEKSGARECVNTETGAITVTNDIFSMPGRNGFDFTLRLRYNSQTAKLSDESTTSVGFQATSALVAYFDVFDATGSWLRIDAKSYASGQTVPATLTESGNQWVFLGYFQSSGASSLSKTAGIANAARNRSATQTAKYSFGAGWSLDLPSVTVEGDTAYVTLEDGQTYQSDGNAATGLAKYELSDVQFSSDTSQLVGTESSAYRLRHADGTEDYFSATGEILLQMDRFGNSIRYAYDGTDAGRYLTAVENSAGLSIRLAYSGTNVFITYGGNSAILERTPVSNGQILSAYVDPVGRRTTYDYSMDSAGFDLLSKTPAQNTYANLYKVGYPTGLKTNYAYISAKKNLSDGYMEYFKVSKRLDQYDGNSYNVQYYSYVGEPDGYPTYKSADVPPGYTYSTTVENDAGMLQVYTYNDKHQPEHIKTVADGTTETTLLRYDGKKNLLVRREQQVALNDGTGGQVSVSTYAYDVLGNVIQESSPPSPELLSGGEYIVTSTYDSRYNLLRSKRYQQDTKTWVEERYILSEDGKTVTSKTVLSNGVVLQEQRCAYDIFGNIIEVSTRSSEDSWTTQRKEYQNGLFPVAVTLSGLENAAGGSDSVTTCYTYDPYTGNVLTKTDGLGFATSYGYDAAGRQLWETLPDGSKRTTAYDDRNNVLTTTDALGAAIVYQYTPSGLIQSVTNGKNGQMLASYAYDGHENLSSEQNAAGTTARYTYDARSRMTEASIFADDGTLVSSRLATYRYDSDATAGICLNITVCTKGDEQDLEQSYFYDACQRLVRQFRGSDTAFVSYDYLGHKVSETGFDGATVHYSYDARSKLTARTDATGATTTYAHDGLGNQTSVTNPLGVTTNTRYDARGLLVRQEAPMDDGSLAVTQYCYDADGRLETQTDGEGGVTTYAYDSRGNLTRAEQMSGNGQSVVSEYEYDREGRMTVRTTGTSSWHYAYDELGRLVSETDALGQVTSYTYDAVGNLSSKTDRNGVVTYYQYDALGRELSSWNSKDGAEQAVTSVYGLDGSLLKQENTEGTISYCYDAFGRQTEEVTQPGFRKVYTYDQGDRVTNLSVYQGSVREMNLSYQYDTAGRLTAVSGDGVTTTYEYDAAGQLVRGENGLTGVVTNYQYTPMGQVKNQASYSAGEILAHTLYQYDGRGNLTAKLENGNETRYWYDGVNRLKTAELPGGVTQDYEYDLQGNLVRLAEVSEGGVSETLYAYDRNNRLLSTDSGDELSMFDCDPVGNLVAKTQLTQTEGGTVSQTSEYLWNGFGQLQDFISPQGDLTEYGYGADGLRMRKTSQNQATRYLCDAGSVIIETDGDGFITAKTTRGMGLISRETEEETFGYLQDAHGDVTALVNPAGELLYDYEYDPYGNDRSQDAAQPYPWMPEENAPDNPFRYCGEYLDSETGSYYLRARYYDPGLGRFLSEDPARDGLNWYAYCYGNPSGFSDPSGNTAKTIGSWKEFDLAGRYGVSWWTSAVAYRYSQKAIGVAEKYALNNGFYTIKSQLFHRENIIVSTKIPNTWANTPDAYRHFIWNVYNVRSMDKNTAILITNLHELANAKPSWYEGKLSDYSSSNSVVDMKLNLDSLMDVWNNAVGIKLGSDPAFSKYSNAALFQYALDHNMLITDPGQVHNKYGFDSSYMEMPDWTVNVSFTIGSYKMQISSHDKSKKILDIDISKLLGG